MIDYDRNKIVLFNPGFIIFSRPKISPDWLKECALGRNEVTNGSGKAKRMERSTLQKKFNVAKYKTTLLVGMLARLK